MNWEAVGVAVGVVIALLGGNAFLMKLVITSAINEALLAVSQQYVTKHDFEEHIKNCPKGR